MKQGQELAKGESGVGIAPIGWEVLLEKHMGNLGRKWTPGRNFSQNSFLILLTSHCAIPLTFVERKGYLENF